MKYVFVLFLLICQSVQSSEIDSFTARALLVADPYPQNLRFINQFVNGLIKEAVDGTTGCDREAFYDNLLSKVGGLIDNPFGPKIENNSSLVKAKPAYDLSIYADVVAPDSLLLPTQMHCVYRPALGMNGLVIGTDKLSHFLHTSYLYFYYVRSHRKPTLRDMLDFGLFTEVTFLGLTTTGVFSRADLAVNYEGFLFWQDLLGERYFDEVRMAQNYVVCVHGQYEQNKQVAFNIETYMSPAWDEGVNCNSYSTRRMAQSVSNRIKKAQAGHACPMEIHRCKTIVDRYRHQPWVLNYLLAPACQVAEKVNFEVLGVPGDPFNLKAVENFTSHPHSFKKLLFSFEELLSQELSSLRDKIVRSFRSIRDEL